MRTHASATVSLLCAALAGSSAGPAAAGSLQIDSGRSSPFRAGRGAAGLSTGGCFDSGPSRESGAEKLAAVVVGSVIATGTAQSLRSSGLPGPMRNFMALSMLDLLQSLLAPLTAPGFLLLTPQPAPAMLGSGSHVPGPWWLDAGGVAGLSAVPGAPRLAAEDLLGGSTSGEGNRGSPAPAPGPAAGLEGGVEIGVR